MFGASEELSPSQSICPLLNNIIVLFPSPPESLTYLQGKIPDGVFFTFMHTLHSDGEHPIGCFCCGPVTDTLLKAKDRDPIA